MTAFALIQTRLLSLDVFRGLTVALMIIVNSPGNQIAYAGLTHAHWHGCTLADLVFPFFIFIAGVSSAFILTRARNQGKTAVQLLPSILKRTLIIFSLGLFLNAFPHHFDLNTVRFFGVLQRIAVCYLVGACLFLTLKISTQAIIAFLILVVYYLLMTLIPLHGIQALTPEANLAAFIDRLLFSSAHLYGKTFDPEGLLSTLPALTTALLGNITGAWLLSKYRPKQKGLGLLGMGAFALFTGWGWSFWFPINKALWTSSYVLWTAGWGWVIFALLYWTIEIKAFRQWANPFKTFGEHALLCYFLHVLGLKIQSMISMTLADGTHASLRLWITEHCFAWAPLKTASLLYALSYALFWLLVIHCWTKRKVTTQHTHRKAIFGAS